MDHVNDSLHRLEGQRLVVTGAAGFIGGALLRRLHAAGLDVLGTALRDEEVAALREAGFTSMRLDLADATTFADALAGADVVFNVAAMFQEYAAGEAEYRKVNCDGAVALCRAAAAAGVRRFVHVSTVGVHGAVKQIPCTEQTPLNPMDAYHRTKLAGEQAITEFARTLPPGDMVVTHNRPSMVYGPGDWRMSYRLCDLLCRGKFIMVGDGQTLAHLGHIDDQVDSLLLSATAPREAVHGEAFNIASDRPCSLNELTTMLAEALAVSPPTRRVPVTPVWLASLLCEMVCLPLGVSPPLFRRRVGFFTHNRAFDCSKAKARLGYTSRRTLAQGLTDTAAWYRQAA